MYHLIASQDRLRVLDSTRERFDFECLNALAPGHYRLPMIEEFAPRTHHHGPGRIFITALSPRDVQAILLAEKAEQRFEQALKFDRLPALPVMPIAEGFSIHGGAEKLFKPVAVGNNQPLTPTDGIRMHNGDLFEMMRYLEPRLSIGQLVVLTVVSMEKQ